MQIFYAFNIIPSREVLFRQEFALCMFLKQARQESVASVSSRALIRRYSNVHVRVHEALTLTILQAKYQRNDRYEKFQETSASWCQCSQYNGPFEEIE